MASPTLIADQNLDRELYRTLAENACDLICQAGTTGRYLYASPNYEQVLGYRPEELIGQSLFKWVHPDDLAEVNRRFILGVVTQQPAQIQFRYRHKNGEWRWLETSGKPFFGWKREWRATFISRDITARRRMEDELRKAHDFRDRVLASTTNAIAALDSEARLVLVNRRMAELTGYTETELKDREMISLVAEADRPRFRDSLDEVIKKQKLTCSEILLLQKRGGQSRFALSLSPLRLANGTNGAVLTGEDVTSLRHAEVEREQMIERLQASQRMETLGTMTAGIAHDFNNIVNTLQMNLELLTMQLRDRSSLTPLLEIQRKSFARVAALTHQLLEFSRHGKPQAGPVNLRDRIDAILGFCSGHLDRRIKVENESPQEAPSAWGNGTQIDQILLNLLLNAGQALASKIERGEPATITLRVEEATLPAPLAHKYRLAEGARMVRLSVRDNGVGIPAEIRDRIFEPFFTTKAAQGNHGLGLATVSGAVKSHQGALSVASEENVGTTFEIYLPMASASRENTATAPALIRTNH